MIARMAWRNVVRNWRRSVSTLLTIAIGSCALLVFAAFMLFSIYGLQTATVQAKGHLAVFRAGYFEFGAGDPAAWSMPDYQALADRLRRDPLVASRIALVTPTLAVSGIAANPRTSATATFFGTGFLPSARDAMKKWDAYGTGSLGLRNSGLDDAEQDRGLIGPGLARVLGLCEAVHLAHCPKRPDPPASEEGNSSIPERDFSGFAESQAPAADDEDEPAIELLSATANGVPNVVQLRVAGTDSQGVKEVDDAYVGMNIGLAQTLVFGRQRPRVTSLVIQLHRTADMAFVRDRLERAFARSGGRFEVKDFTQLAPYYLQTLDLFGAFFLFVALLIGVVVLFSVSNAMSMSVVERTPEIGTLRALGLRRAGVRRLFLAEGAVIGVAGATLGVALAMLVAAIVNRSAITWTPPGNSQPVPFRLYSEMDWRIVAAVWGGLVAVTLLSSLAPAFRAARLSVANALRHV
jgi:putative ABC transport system permease protein